MIPRNINIQKTSQNFWDGVLGIPVDAGQPETMAKYAERMLKDDSSESEEKKTREVKVATFGRTDGVDYSNVDVVPDAPEDMHINEAQMSEDAGL